jgi:hypothetical protein
MISIGRLTITRRTPARGGWFGRVEAWLNTDRYFTIYKLGPIWVGVWPS